MQALQKGKLLLSDISNHSFSVSSIRDIRFLYYTTKCNEHSVLNNAHFYFTVFLCRVSWQSLIGACVQGLLGHQESFTKIRFHWRFDRARLEESSFKSTRCIFFPLLLRLLMGCWLEAVLTSSRQQSPAMCSSPQEVHNMLSYLIKPIFLQPIFKIPKCLGPNKSGSY